MSDEKQTVSLRDALEANMSAADEGTLEKVQDAPEIVDEDPLAGKSAPSRDEKGKFSQKSQEANDVVAKDVQVEAPEVAPEPVVNLPERPSSWKKEYLPIWDKVATGQPLSPEEGRKLAEYSTQREKEYAAGIASYKNEAQAANDFKSAVEPFLPAIKQHNTDPATWIKTMGAAHYSLVTGTPEQKIQMFAKLAQDYGVPIGAVGQAQQGHLDPVVPQMLQYIQNLEQKLNTVSGRFEQQDQHAVQQEISRFMDASKYPHFEQVRNDMARLLESGFAQNPDEAYAKAVRLHDEVWNADQERQAQTLAAKQLSEKTAVVAKAKAHAVSVKSVTPSGAAVTVDAKDRRSVLESKLDAMLSGRV